MKKIFLLYVFFIPLLLNGQVERSKEIIDRKSSRKKNKEEKKSFEGSLKIIVSDDYDPNSSLTIDKKKGEWLMGKKSREL